MRRLICGYVGASYLLWGSAPSFARQDASAQVRVLSESEAVAALMASDPNIRALLARIEEVRAREAARVLWPNPGFVYTQESVGDSQDVFVVARQELPISGRRGRLREAGRLAVEAIEADVRFLIADVQSELRRAFTALLLAQEREAAMRRGIQELRRLVEMLRLREEAGEGSRYDRMRGERALVDLVADLAAIEAARAEAQGRLAAYLGERVLPHALAAEGPLDLAAPPPPVEALVEQALMNRSDYQASVLEAARFEAEREAAVRMRVPTPTLTGGLKRSGIGDLANGGYQVSLDLSLPLFNRGQTAEALAIAQASRAEAEAAALRLRIESQVRAAYAVAALYQSRAERYREAASETAEPLVAIGRIGYEDGEMGILELLDAIRQALDARLRGLDLTAAARVAAIDLDRVTGTEFQP